MVIKVIRRVWIKRDEKITNWVSSKCFLRRIESNNIVFKKK